MSSSPPPINIMPDYQIYRSPSFPIDPSTWSDEANDTEVRDYISADRFNMLDFRGQYFFVKTETKLKLQNIATDLPLTLNTRRLRDFRKECYQVTKDIYIDEDLLTQIATWYSHARRDHSVLSLHENAHTHLYLTIARYYMVPHDLYYHFRNFDPLNDLDERYERSQAIEALLNHKVPGTWLLRHSSYNRPSNPNTLSDIIRFGLRYYVLSYSKLQAQTLIIKHLLITFDVTQGWSHSETMFPNFLDCLEDLLSRYNLRYIDLYNDYYKNS